MKLTCQRCGQKIQVPDEWAGKAIRCKGCNKIIRLPAVQAEPINLDALASQEPQDELPTDWPDFAAASAEPATDSDSTSAVRVCPYCGKSLQVSDPQLEVLCSACWRPVPPTAPAGTASPSQDQPGRVKAYQPLLPVGFYTGVFGAMTFPIGAAGSILLAVMVAILLILVPVGLLLAIAEVLRQEPVYGHQYQLEWAGPLLAVLFGLELLYFFGVSYYALIDTIRSTLVGSERPPNLTWNITTVGQAFLGYLSFVLYYAALVLALILLANHGQLVLPRSATDLATIFSTPHLVLLALLTFMVPMSLIGMASGSFLEGINPLKVLLSIVRTGGHYVFLFCVACLYVALYCAAMAALLDWTGQTILQMLRKTGQQSIPALGFGLLLWGLLIGVGFYFAYMIGRLHGLFARAFRDRLAFDL
ncbi:MAG: hypothetical protein ACE5K7_01035 [Phycisphaerae bacterium]